MLTEATVRASLAEIPYPGLSRDIVSLGLVRSVAVRNDRVHVSLALASPREDVPDRLREAVRERLARAGAIRSEVYSRTRIDGNPPRELIRLTGIRQPFNRARIVAGSKELLQVRTGYHAGNQLHVVLDLAHPSVQVTEVEEGPKQLRVRLQRR